MGSGRATVTRETAMREFGRQEFIGLAAVVMVLMAAMFWMYRSSNTPEPTRNTYLIKAGGVAPALVTPKSSGLRSRRNPGHLQYESTAGAVSVYVVRSTIAYRAEQWDSINKLTDEFA